MIFLVIYFKRAWTCAKN